MGPYCLMWLRLFGMVLPACYLPPWAGKAVWPRAGWGKPGAVLPPGAAAPPGVAPGAPMVGWLGAGMQDVAGLGQWRPFPEPGAQLAPVIGPTGPLGAPVAAQAGPDVPDPWLQTIGPPGTPIAPGSAGAAGDPIGSE